MKNQLFIFFQHLAPQHLLSRCFAIFAASTNPKLKNFIIKRFIRKYKVNMNEAIHSEAEDYNSFNDFFTRQLKTESRIINEANDAIVSPADGIISAIGNIQSGELIQAKGKYFSLVDLLGGNEETAEVFDAGNFVTIYLSPKDYHRVHLPFSGTLRQMIFIPGKLFSVNQTTSENIPNLFARNERVICIFETEIGPMAVILVGAMIVASIETVWAGQVAPSSQQQYLTEYSERQAPIHIEKGLEMGRFKLGSTVILLFGPGLMNWESPLMTNASIQVGQKIGTTKVQT
jgi:phosphatidylserine decarboxylase